MQISGTETSQRKAHAEKTIFFNFLIQLHVFIFFPEISGGLIL